MSAILDYYPRELEEHLVNKGHPKYRVAQLLHWIYQRQAGDFREMSNLGRLLQEELAATFLLSSLKLLKKQGSKDGQTTKLLWELADGQWVESVIIQAPGRITLCVSSQVGCPARCAFCASGKEGLKRNLTAAEIVDQVYQAKKLLSEEGKRLTHLVFMGMGEPLMNYPQVKKALTLLTHPQCMGFSPRRITVSTVGIPDKIYDFIQEGLKVQLVLSLHAPNQKIRKKIIPYARLYEYEDLLEAMKAFAKASKRDITYEYILIKGINDAPEHAEELAQRLKNHPCCVNLIPYNPVVGLQLHRPEHAAVHAFRQVLNQRGIVNTCRYTKGVDIAAACGQLAMKKKPQVSPS